ncbi:phospholipid biosynthesis protein [Janibacter sp. Soil728]|uniref:HAD-IB family hydrolase n=1 Tax=Janibacter sp. Soil728 TaxID=1736393 RepID=UPI000700A108|nr:HAD-IB family hydrolase [Janibacter sp. Soil728]KRE38811.1 phospholipid biosynthesis protein [Janibacter sp. Soil728]
MTGAAFFDLDRTLLPKASGPALSAAMRQTGVVSARVPGESLLFGYFNLLGESLGSIALARQAVLVARGRPADAFDEAALLAADVLEPMVGPFAKMLIKEHQEAGRPVVLATTTPEHLVRPLAERLGIDAVIATRYEVGEDGRFTGRNDGHFVWSMGKIAAVREWSQDNGIDLDESFAYSDSIYDAPLLKAVGNPGAVNPDPRLQTLAIAARWPVLHFDTSPGVMKLPVIGMEVQRMVSMLARPEVFPYAKFTVTGAENVPLVGPAILVGNHRSYFDVVAMLVAMGRAGRTARFLGKKELFDVPALGAFFRAIGGVSVDRRQEDPDSPDAFAAAVRSIAGGEMVAMMPEGTIPRGINFFEPGMTGYPGAARLAQLTKVPVIPFAITGTEKVWPRSSRVPRVLNLLDRPEVTVTFGEPVDLKYRSVPRDMERVFDAITAMLPDEVREPARPTLAELALTYPDGKVPGEDRWYAVDGADED